MHGVRLLAIKVVHQTLAEEVLRKWRTSQLLLEVVLLLGAQQLKELQPRRSEERHFQEGSAKVLSGFVELFQFFLHLGEQE